METVRVLSKGEVHTIASWQRARTLQFRRPESNSQNIFTSVVLFDSKTSRLISFYSATSLLSSTFVPRAHFTGKNTEALKGFEIVHPRSHTWAIIEAELTPQLAHDRSPLLSFVCQTVSTHRLL